MITNGDPRLFFQFVAAIVPALLFGGVLLQVLKAPSKRALAADPFSWRGSGVVVALVYLPVMVEVIAVSGTVGYPADTFETTFVALYVVGATAVVGGLLAKPWLLPMVREIRRYRRHSNARWVLVPTAVLAALTLLGAARTMSSAVTGIQRLNDENAESEAELKANSEALDGALTGARSSQGGSPHSSRGRSPTMTTPFVPTTSRGESRDARRESGSVGTPV